MAAAADARRAAPAGVRPRRGNGSQGGGLHVSARRSPTIFDSFNYAFEGLIHVLRTQRNMRLHFAVAVIVLVVAIAVGVSKIELIALLISITFVLVAEMINAVAVGYLVFSGKVADRSARLLDRVRDAPAELTIVALAVTVIIVISLKAWTGSGTPLRGGLPSGHAALAFAAWIAATYVAGQDHRFLVSTIALVMALLVAQTRIESGVHSSIEVALGGVLGTLTTLALFQLAG